MNQWFINQVLAQEPGLEFVGPEDVTDHQIIRPLITQLVSSISKFPALANDYLVRIQQPGNLHWNFFPSLWWTLNASSFSDVGGHRDG